MIKKLKYACIGAGGIANKKHLNNYAKINEIELVAICDIDIEAAKKLADKYHVPYVYSDYHEMIRNHQLDIVSVCTPNNLHAGTSIDLLQAGVNVHCEKPLALNPREVSEIIRVKNKSEKKLMVALNNRFTDEVVHLKKIINSGFLGKIYQAKCGWRRNSGIPGIGKWFTNKKISGGGPLIDLGVHFLDLTLYLMGFPSAISVSGATYANFKRDYSRIRVGYKNVPGGKFDVEDTANGLVRLNNDATLTYDFSWAANIEKECQYVEILGTDGGISFLDGEIKLFTQMEGVCYTLKPDTRTMQKAQQEYQHFVDCIIENREPLATAEQAYEIMQIIEAAYFSAADGKEIVIDSLNKIKLMKVGNR